MLDFVDERANIENSVYGFEMNQSFDDSGQGQRVGKSGGGFSKGKFKRNEMSGNRATSLVTTGEKGNTKTERKKCRCCEGECKRLNECEKFKGFSPSERKEYVRKNRLCNNCLIYNHMAKECRRGSCCDVTDCGKKHHALLHECFAKRGMT